MNEILDFTAPKGHRFIEMPDSMKKFIEDIISVYKKHNLSISHEDEHGAFIIDEYNEDNIGWLLSAYKRYKDRFCLSCRNSMSGDAPDGTKVLVCFDCKGHEGKEMIVGEEECCENYKGE